jgi:MoaA/NifB/PqqE/SkfB family radical SAM enzyme
MRLVFTFIGGSGEPLFHKRAVEWIAQARALGARVEPITNGTRLAEQKVRELVEARLDPWWASIDGATPRLRPHCPRQPVTRAEQRTIVIARAEPSQPFPSSHHAVPDLP